MIKRLETKNFTVLRNANLEFSEGLNVIIGENGSGKTHLIKLLYSILACYKKMGDLPVLKTLIQQNMARKLNDVFRPDYLGRLTTRRQGRDRTEVSMYHSNPDYNCTFSFASNSKSEVNFTKYPKFNCGRISSSVYFPAKELLTLYPNFVSMYDTYNVEYDVTYYDTIKLLGLPYLKGMHSKSMQGMINDLEGAIGGHIYLDKKGQSFYITLQPENDSDLKGNMEINLAAEGWRKIGMLTQVLLNGALKDKGILFWDEPEANLNPKLITVLARILYRMSNKIQVFITTHSLFLMRELEYLSRSNIQSKPVKYFCFHKTGEIEQSYKTYELKNIAAFEEEIAQEDRVISLAGKD